MQLNLIRCALVAARLLLTLTPALADTPGRHPAYLHARSDLRRAERLMRMREEPGAMRDLALAADEAQAAIREIDEAAALDAKNLNNNPPVDTYPDRRGRFRAIGQLPVFRQTRPRTRRRQSRRQELAETRPPPHR